MVNVCPDALLDDGLLDVVLMFGRVGEQVRWGRGDLVGHDSFESH
jgi:hypothetical protein